MIIVACRLFQASFPDAPRITNAARRGDRERQKHRQKYERAFRASFIYTLKAAGVFTDRRTATVSESVSES
jgi:hypothetical protein